MTEGTLMKETLELLGLNKNATREITTIINNLLFLDQGLDALTTERELVLTEFILKLSKEIRKEETREKEKALRYLQMVIMKELWRERNVITTKSGIPKEEIQRIPENREISIPVETNQLFENREQKIIEEIKKLFYKERIRQQKTNEKIDALSERVKALRERLEVLRPIINSYIEDRMREMEKERRNLLETINQNKELVMGELRKMKQNIREMSAENVALQKEFIQKIDRVLELDLSSNLDQELFEERIQEVLEFLYPIKTKMSAIEKQVDLLIMGQEDISQEINQQTEQGKEKQQELLEKLTEIEKRIDMNELEKINHSWQEMQKTQDPKTKIKKLSELIFKVFKWGVKGIAGGFEFLKILGMLDLFF